MGVGPAKLKGHHLTLLAYLPASFKTGRAVGLGCGELLHPADVVRDFVHSSVRVELWDGRLRYLAKLPLEYVYGGLDGRSLTHTRIAETEHVFSRQVRKL